MAPLPRVTHHGTYRPVLRGSLKCAWNAMASSSERVHKKKRKMWDDGISWRLTRSSFIVFIQNFRSCLAELQSSQCQDIHLTRQSLLCSSCNFSWLEEVSQNSCGQPRYCAKTIYREEQRLEIRKPRGNLPWKYLPRYIYIVTCPVICMKENAAKVVTEFNYYILQFSTSGRKKILIRLLNLYSMFMFCSLNFNFQFFYDQSDERDVMLQYFLPSNLLLNLQCGNKIDRGGCANFESKQMFDVLYKERCSKWQYLLQRF